MPEVVDDAVAFSRTSYDCIFLFPVLLEEVSKVIAGLKVNKSTDIEGISNKTLNNALILFNESTQ